MGDVSTAVSGLNNFVSCDVVQDTSEEIVIEETPKQEMVAEASNEEATPDLAKEPEVDKSHEVVDDLPKDLNEANETARSEEEPEVVDLSDDDDVEEQASKDLPKANDQILSEMKSKVQQLCKRAKKNVVFIDSNKIQPPVQTPQEDDQILSEMKSKVQQLCSKAKQVSEDVVEIDSSNTKPKQVLENVIDIDQPPVQIKPLPKLPAGLQVIRSVDLLDEPPERRPPPPLIEINPRTPKKSSTEQAAARPSPCSREDILRKLPKSTNIVASPSLSQRFDALKVQKTPSPGKKSSSARNLSITPSSPRPRAPSNPVIRSPTNPVTKSGPTNPVTKSGPTNPVTNRVPSMGQISLTPCAPPAEIAEFVDLSEEEDSIQSRAHESQPRQLPISRLQELESSNVKQNDKDMDMEEEVAVLPAPPPLLRIGQAVTLPEVNPPPPPSSQNLRQGADLSSQFRTPQKRPSTSSEARDWIQFIHLISNQ